MTSVTERIKIIQKDEHLKQPRGGYINIKQFKELELEKINDLKPKDYKCFESIGQGLCVDYLFRYMSGYKKDKAFKTSIIGAERLSFYLKNKAIYNYAKNLIKNINGLDENSIRNSFKLVQFDIGLRNINWAIKNFNLEEIKNIETNDILIYNIRKLVERILWYFKDDTPLEYACTFETAYTKYITSGDCDFITSNTLWDIKVSKSKPKKEDTLQVLIYYLLGCRTQNNNFKNITYLGIINPLLNKVYILDINHINKNTIDKINNNIIGYDVLNLKNNYIEKNMTLKQRIFKMLK